MSDPNFAYVPKHLATRTHEDMKAVLMSPDAQGPAVHYYMIRGGSQQRNVTVWEPGKVGGEYIKTFGHYHVGPLDETYEILEGQGFVLQERLEVNEAGEMVADRVAEFKVIPIKAGDSVFIPAGSGHLAVNTGDTYMVTTDDSPVNFDDSDPSGHPGHADYSLVRQTRGFAYYVVERDGAPALVKNPHYSVIANEDLGGLSVVEA